MYCLKFLTVLARLRCLSLYYRESDHMIIQCDIIIINDIILFFYNRIYNPKVSFYLGTLRKSYKKKPTINILLSKKANGGLHVLFIMEG